MTGYVPNPANYEMKKNPPKPEAQPNASQSNPYGVTDDQLAILDSMTLQELNALTRRLLCQCGMAATMTDEETAQAMLDTLAATALRPIAVGVSMRADIQSRMTAIEKWLDRTQGKAIQRIDQRIQTMHGVLPAEMTTAQILEQLSKLELPANVKLIEGKVEVVESTGGS